METQVYLELVDNTLRKYSYGEMRKKQREMLHATFYYKQQTTVLP